MAETKHTPGEWLTEKLLVYALDETGRVNRFSASVQPGYVYGGNRGGHSERTSEAELLANTQLIAAAPDLLKVCKMFLEEASPLSLHECISAAEAAIAKAEGRFHG